MASATFEDHPTDPDKVILRKKPYLDKGRDYEEGFVDGMQHQMQSSVDKAVNRMAQPEQNQGEEHMTKDEIIKLIEDNGLTLHGDIEHFAALVAEHTYTKYLEPPEAKQSGTISITTPTPVAYLCENAVGHKYFRWKKPSSAYKPVALYTIPPPCPTCEALARTVMMDQTGRDA